MLMFKIQRLLLYHFIRLAHLENVEDMHGKWMNKRCLYLWESVKLESIVRTYLSQLSMQINSDLRSGPSQIAGLLSENETSTGIFRISFESIIYISHVSIVYMYL